VTPLSPPLFFKKSREQKALKKRSGGDTRVTLFLPVFFCSSFPNVCEQRKEEMPKVKYIHPKISEEAFYDTKEVAAILGLSYRTIQSYRGEGKGLNFIDVSYKVKLYSKRELAKYIATRTRASTSATSDKGQCSDTLVEEIYQSLPSPSFLNTQKNRPKRLLSSKQHTLFAFFKRILRPLFKGN
jgi:hypothetical protein